MATYNIVNQGADDTGGSTIDSVLDGLVGDNNTVIFDPGTYLLHSLSVPSGVSNFTIIAPNGATLRPVDGSTPWIDVSGPGFEWHNFEIDNAGLDHPGSVRILGNNWELTRLIVRGVTRSNTDGQSPGHSGPARTWFRVEVPSSGATGLVEDCYFHNGSGGPGYLSNRRCFLVEQGHGDIRFNRCWFDSWGENTIYAQQPAGKVTIYNCYARNTQNPYRVGGNTTIRNCVSIRDAHSVYQGWSADALQTGVRIEAKDAGGADMDGWSGTLEIFDSDFYHRYRSSGDEKPPTGACAGGSSPTQRLDIRNCRMSFDANRNQDCLYTGNNTDNQYLQLQNIHIRNDAPSGLDALIIGQTPNSWGTVSGVIGGSNTTTSGLPSGHNFTIGGSPTAPNTTPPLPNPPSSGVPHWDSAFVLVDNSTAGTTASYTINANIASHPSGRGDRPINMEWGAGTSTPPRNEPTATGTIPAGGERAFYAEGGVSSIETTGDPIVTVDGELYDESGSGETDPPDATSSLLHQYDGTAWQSSAMQVANADGTHTARPLYWFTGTAWETAYDPGGGTGSPGSVVDNFEDGDLAEYTFTSASDATFTAQTGPTAPHSGDWYLLADGTAGGFGAAYSTSGLSTYPSAGDTISVFWRPQAFPSPEHFRIWYGAAGPNNHYEMKHIRGSTDAIELTTWNGGTATHSGEIATSGSLSQLDWYETRIDWGTDGSHTATVIDPSGSQIGSVSFSDSTRTSGGIGFYVGGNTTVRVDDVTIQ